MARLSARLTGPPRRTAVNVENFLVQIRIVRPVPRLCEVVLAVKFLVAQIGQDQDAPTVHRLAAAVGHICRRKRLILVVIVVQRNSDLLEMIAALHAPRSFTRLTREYWKDQKR